MKNKNLIRLILVFFVVVIFISSSVSANVNKKWDWHKVDGNGREHKRTIHWCWDSNTLPEAANWIQWIVQAAANWNNANIGWNLEFTDDPAKCQVIIKFGDIPVPGSVGARDITDDGWLRGATITFDTNPSNNPDKPASGWGTSGSNVYDPVVVAKHELGHLLRLDHSFGVDDRMNVQGPGYHNHSLSSDDRQEASDSANSTGRKIRNVFRPFGYFISDNNGTIEIPKGALPESAEIKFSNIINWDIEKRTHVPEGYGYIATAIEIESDIKTFDEPITVTMVYTDEEIGGDFAECYSPVYYPLMIESELKAFVFNPSTLSWDLISDSTVDVDANTVTFKTDRVGIFGISGPEKKYEYVDLLVKAYDDVIKNIPMAATIFGNERINIYVDGEIRGHLVTKDSEVVGSGEDELQDQTMNVHISEETIEEIVEGKITFAEALKEGKIRYEGVGFFNSLKFGVLGFFFNIYSLFQ